ncbi:MAG: hypothetical protein HY243_05130 [Proteobacteria bacterium]|nr:hypothetical protein [Pseudomonadota bacterium]
MRHIRSAAGDKRITAFVVAALAFAPWLSGCGSVDDALFGSDSQPVAADTTQPTTDQSQLPGTLPGTLPGAVVPVTTGTSTTITPIGIEAGSDTGTAVNRKIQQLRNDVSTLQSKIVSNADQLASLRSAAAAYAGTYHEAKAQITQRLQMGTTRGNPELVAQWNTAQSALDQLTTNINGLTAAGTDITGDSSSAHYALDTIQATFNVSGAVDEDHRQLSVLQDETNQTIVLIDKLLTDVSSDVQRQTAYVANERANLTTLAAAIKNGELYGGELGNVMMASATTPPGAYGPGLGSTPLVTIKFDRAGVEYQQILYTALAQALQSRPSAGFDVVAVSPTRGTAAAVQLAQTSAKRHAQEVFRSMTDMGVPATRLAISSATDPSIGASEVRVFVR